MFYQKNKKNKRKKTKVKVEIKTINQTPPKKQKRKVAAWQKRKNEINIEEINK